MSAAAYLKPFVPPILWSALRRLAGRPAEVARDLHAMVRRDRFTIAFHRARVGGDSFFVPAYGAHRPAARAILSGALYEPATHALVADLLARRPGSMVHAGTFFGDMLPGFARACPGRVYAFEPVLESYTMARLGVQENGLDNVVLLHAALGAAIAVVRMDTGAVGESHSGGAAQIGARGQRVTMLPLDALEIADLSVLQLDVEGHEAEALRGARDTLARCAPVVLLEDNAGAGAALMAETGYDRAGAVPGLEVWAPPDEAAAIAARVAAVPGPAA